MRRDLGWRGRCEAAAVTAKVVASGAWFGSVVFILKRIAKHCGDEYEKI
jgi:hypothetical protein